MAQRRPGRPRNAGKHGRPGHNQAAKIVARFGGEAALALLLGISRISVYRWQYRRPYGSDGLVPTAHIEKLKAIAREQGILIRPEDWVPEALTYGEDNQVLQRKKGQFIV